MLHLNPCMKNIKWCICFCTLLCILMLCGCADDTEDNEPLAENVKIELQDVDKTEKGEMKQMSKMVSVNEFKAYYGMDDNIVPDEYIYAFIEKRNLSIEDLEKRKYNLMVKKLYDSNISYDANIDELITGEENTDFESMALEDITHVIMLNDLPIRGTDMCEPEYIVLDVEKKKIYVSHENVTTNYRSAETVFDVTDSWIKDCITNVKKILADNGAEILDEQKSFELGWHLYFVCEDKKVLMRMGVVSSKENAFYNWYHTLAEGGNW